MAGESIQFSLGTNNRAFTTGLNAAKQQVANFKGEVAGVLTGLFAGIGIEQLISDFARVQDIADQLGITAEEVQRVRGAADTAGTGIEFVAKQMTKATAEARKLADGVAQIDTAGSGASRVGKAFEALGINVKDFVSLPLDQQLLAISAGMDGIPDEGAKIAAAIDLFGAKGKEMVPLLIQGQESLQAEFERTAVVSNEMVAQIAAADDDIARMTNTVKVGAVGLFVFIDRLAKSVGAFLGSFAAAASVFIDEIGGVFEKVKAGDFSGAVSTLNKAATQAAIAANAGFQSELENIWSAPEVEAKAPRIALDDEEATAGTEKRLSLEERLAEIREEAARKQLTLEQQILALKDKQAEATDASLASGLDPKAKKAFEDEAVDAAKQVASLEEKQRSEAESAQNKMIAEQKKADDEAKAKAERVLALRGQLHQRELEKMGKDEKNAALLKDLQELAGRNVKDEEEKLKLQVEAGEIVDRISQDQSQQYSLPDDLVTRLGGSNGATYNGPMMAESQRQTELQKKITTLLEKIEAKSFVVDLPEAD